jgi:hypothetical protein
MWGHSELFSHADIVAGQPAPRLGISPIWISILLAHDLVSIAASSSEDAARR